MLNRAIPDGIECGRNVRELLILWGTKMPGTFCIDISAELESFDSSVFNGGCVLT